MFHIQVSPDFEGANIRPSEAVVLRIYGKRGRPVCRSLGAGRRESGFGVNYLAHSWARRGGSMSLAYGGDDVSPSKLKTPWGGPRGKGGYYEKLMEVIFSFIT
jgi:hypothetical protein